MSHAGIEPHTDDGRPGAGPGGPVGPRRRRGGAPLLALGRGRVGAAQVGQGGQPGVVGDRHGEGHGVHDGARPVPAGGGTHGKKDRSLHAAFAGAVRFTGDHGLDLRLAGRRVTVEDGRGTLYAGANGTACTVKRVPLVTFTAKDLLAPKNGPVQLTEAPSSSRTRGPAVLVAPRRDP
ncbi:hypothetical protein EAO69_36935 [Streptomyces sp. me109]|nr:hypothetical protein EAO69_36935 [Streptomyces sp. me109]